MDSYLHPGVLSELVRDKERNNKEVRGAVSALEVAQTARLVQTATATCTAFQGVAERGAAGNIENAYSYVCNKRFLPAQGVRYFLDGREYLASFDAEYETSQKLRDSYSEFRAMGNSDDYIRRLYASMQVDAFREAAVEAYTFLNRSHLVCRLPLTLPELLDSSLSALLKRYSRKNEADLLEAVGEYGSLTEAVVQQYLSLLAAPSPWQQCENCGRLFKRPKGAKPGKKLRTTRFCSRSCNVSFNQKKTAE